MTYRSRMGHDTKPFLDINATIPSPDTSVRIYEYTALLVYRKWEFVMGASLSTG